MTIRLKCNVTLTDASSCMKTSMWLKVCWISRFLSPDRQHRLSSAQVVMDSWWYYNATAQVSLSCGARIYGDRHPPAFIPAMCRRFAHMSVPHISSITCRKCPHIGTSHRRWFHGLRRWNTRWAIYGKRINALRWHLHYDRNVKETWHSIYFGIWYNQERRKGRRRW